MKAQSGYLRGQQGRFSQLTRSQLSKLISPEQRSRLGDWLGDSIEGATEALKGPIDPGSKISTNTLQVYRALAQRSIAAGKDNLSVQSLRLKVINRALDYRYSLGWYR
jgi:hypothetical protein